MEIEKKAARKIQIRRQLPKIKSAEYLSRYFVGLARVFEAEFQRKVSGYMQQHSKIYTSG